ncbi:hypothetical protein ACFXTH_041844 [Malus domestica]
MEGTSDCSVVAVKIVICDSGIRPRVQEGHEVKDAGAIEDSRLLLLRRPSQVSTKLWIRKQSTPSSTPKSFKRQRPFGAPGSYLRLRLSIPKTMLLRRGA